ncbi:unnamed protein product [Peniophora sp. CBMAI 1063]|nr:unnamed protein product [Peniophora sp. CBMAI 1063]
MVSELYVASASGDLDKVSALLEGGNVDLEIKDHEGVSPLIVAAKNGHLKVVEKLLEKGADPLNPGAHGPPESYATDSLIIDTLRAAAINKAQQAAQAAEANGYMHGQPPNGYYMPPPGAYYYPPPPEGMGFYPPPPHQQPNGEMQGPPPAHNSNLPPPEIARLIPCRYFPACRYGASCMFAHPGPYGMPPPPPHGAPYPGPYENGAPGPYQPNFYPMPPPNFAPNGMPLSPQSPPQGVPPMMHQRSASDMLSPVQPGFPAGMPGPMPYGPTSPVAQPPYGAPNGVPPMSLPPMAAPGPQSPPQAYPQTAVPQSAQQPYEPPQEMASVPASAPAQQTTYVQVPAQKTTPPLANGDAPQLNGHRADGFGHHRRGSSFRRGPSFGSRKPPCAFFPSGRCRNGDDCRFPHVSPDAAPAPVHHAPPPFMGRRGGFRGPPVHHAHAHSVNGVNGANGVQTNGNGNGAVNGLEDGFANLNVRDEPQRGRGSDRTTSSASSSQARAGPGKPGLPLNGVNGARSNGKPAVLPKQRVPNADEFPVLAGTTTPPARSPLGAPAGLGGPTAAQVLQNPAPSRKDLVKDLFRGGAPKTSPPAEAATPVSTTPSTTATPAPAPVATTPKLPVSFAAMATGAPEASKEVSVAA